ncbi:N-methyl-L-tryptophan oxidase [Algoriphagus boseongensis]|nr:N-methyl-L-tryptophan oxidase [Algoriphagus boseongensis]
MQTPLEFDIAVIGLGAVGSSALYQLSKSGKRVLGIDRFDPPHVFGSSHGETRITRLAVGEGEDYVALAKRSHEIWRELEQLSGEKIMTQTGGIQIDSGVIPWAKHGAEGFWERTVSFAKSQKINHKILSVEEFRKTYPAFAVPDSGKIYFEVESGFLRPELAIETQLRLAKSNGATIQPNSPVLAIQKEGGNFKIKTSSSEFICHKLLISAGGWIKDFLGVEQREGFKICRQILHWLEIEPGFDAWQNHPVWMWGFGSNPEDFIYGFPALDGKTVKMATELFLAIDHPDLLNREVSKEEQIQFWETKVKGRINGVLPNFVKSQVCFYTVTEDARFVIEPWNGDSRAILVSACSGHGFKHSAALGEKLAQQLLEA